MSIRNLIILSQLNPPAQSRRILKRDRINKDLSKSIQYPLTILAAGTGYGKSTAILSYINDIENKTYWFTISGADRDPRLFLAKLFSAFNQHGDSIGAEALRVLEVPESTHKEALIALLNEVTRAGQSDMVLIFDDFHRISDVDEIIGYLNWLIENLPQKLHIIIATRHNIKFPNLSKWRVKGQILEINKHQLIFNIEETNQLFTNQYGINLSLDETQQLLNNTEGWAIGLQLVWQTLNNNPKLRLNQVFLDSHVSRKALFEYLAEEVFLGLSSEIQTFLVHSSLLSKLENTTCDFLLNIGNSEELLTRLNNSGLFIEELRPGVYRYHQIFREFLLSRLKNEYENILIKDLNRKLASYFQAHEYWEEAIYHLISAGDFDQINRILINIGERMIQEGRYESVDYWIHGIPDDKQKQFPYINFLLGELNRYRGRFNEALEFYNTSERLFRIQQNDLGVSRALRGQGQVFLDTIRPLYANQLLEDALELLDPVEMKEEVADLLVLTAENQLNLGFPERAEALLHRASELSPELINNIKYIQARVLLRTGRLQEGIDLLINLQDDIDFSVAPARPQRFHRESPLLLSLFYSIRGERFLAEEYAWRGLEIGKLLQSMFVQSVSYMRLGHARMLLSQIPFNHEDYNLAMNYFQEAIEKVDVVRIHVEPLWGMCRALGYSGKFDKAEKAAEEALAIAKNAGDEWISILIRLSIGVGALLAGKLETAQMHLTTAEVSSIKVKDSFVLCVSRMWLAITAWLQGYQNTAYGYLRKLLSVVSQNGYEFLLERETLLGLKDPEMIFPLLLSAKANHVEEKCILSLLRNRGLDENLAFHPGYSIWVQTLGEFNVWRGENLITQQDWKRDKAKQLCQLLVANREKWFSRDQINSILWPDTPGDKAANYLKVVINTLNQVLEPERPRGAPAFFIERNQDKYRLNPKSRIIVDVDNFINLIKKGTTTSLDNAISLYKGRYLENCFIQQWFMVEEQFYHQKFLTAADQLAVEYIDNSEYEKALKITYGVLIVDELWEPAYRLQMRIFHNLGQSSMVRNVFIQCKNAFREQLDSDISPATQALFDELLAG